MKSDSDPVRSSRPAGGGDPPSSSSIRAPSASSQVTLSTDRANNPGIRASSVDFSNNLITHEVFPFGTVPWDIEGVSDLPEPDNLAELRLVINKRRNSVTEEKLPESMFKELRASSGLETNKTRVRGTLLPSLKSSTHNEVEWGSSYIFEELTHLTDGTIVHPAPDRFRGVSVTKLKHAVLNELKPYIQPMIYGFHPILPFLFLGFRGFRGVVGEALLRACNNGVAGARARDLLNRYGAPDSSSRYDNKAYVITCTYVAGMLTLYTVHPGPPTSNKSPKDRTSYFMNVIDAYPMLVTADKWRAGIAAFNNASDWAHEEMMKVVRQANARNDFFQLNGHFEADEENADHDHNDDDDNDDDDDNIIVKHTPRHRR